MNNMTYLHRNGETEPPTVEGWYWVQTNAPYSVWQGVLMRYVSLYDDILDKPVTHIAYRIDSIGAETLEAIGHSLRWWGPVIPPWDDE